MNAQVSSALQQDHTVTCDNSSGADSNCGRKEKRSFAIPFKAPNNGKTVIDTGGTFVKEKSRFSTPKQNKEKFKFQTHSWYVARFDDIFSHSIRSSEYFCFAHTDIQKSLRLQLNDKSTSSQIYRTSKVRSLDSFLYYLHSDISAI
jgi:hypothetical protein